jgi:hypothetical protein
LLGKIGIVDYYVAQVDLLGFCSHISKLYSGCKKIAKPLLLYFIHLYHTLNNIVYRRAKAVCREDLQSERL